MSVKLDKLKYYATVAKQQIEIVKFNIVELCNSNQSVHTYTNNNQTYINNASNGWSNNKNIWSGNRISWIFILICVMLCNMLVVRATDQMCDIIAATNIQSISGYSQWSCTAGGVTSTTPCSAPVWNGLGCSGSNVVFISISSTSLRGNMYD